MTETINNTASPCNDQDGHTFAATQLQAPGTYTCTCGELTMTVTATPSFETIEGYAVTPSPEVWHALSE
jgi:hypothetical protein